MGTISMVLPAEDRWFFNEIGRGAQARSASAGHDVELSRIPAGVRSAADAADQIEAAFAAGDCLGAVAAGIPYRRGAVDSGRLAAWKRPLVVIGGSMLGSPVVTFDDIGIARTATTHLRELGHTRIAYLTGPLDPDSAFVFHRARARGYRLTMEGLGLVPQVVEAELDGPYLQEQIRELLTGPARPTAVFAVYDEIAFAVMDVAESLGLQIGRDLSVVGVNDHPDADRRGLTTVRHSPTHAGAAAVEMILDGLEAGLAPLKSRLTPSTFVHRTSSRKPQSAARS